MKETKLQPHELPYMRDGKIEMQRNPNPKKYFIIRNRKDNSVKYATSNESDEHYLELRQKAERKGSTTRYVAEWYPDDETAEAALEYKFKKDEVDHKTN